METITTSLTLGEPQRSDALAVFPAFGPDPRVAYRSFAQAAELGAFVKELDGGASVNDLLIENPTDQALLVYEGEEVLGAQQNRTFDASVLVAAGMRLRLPVSCVERGRWDGRRGGEHFRVSPQAADPSLRRVKRARSNLRAAAGLDARPDQGEVWNEVQSRLVRHDIESPSHAMSDLYDGRRGQLERMVSAIRPLDGQVGALVGVEDRVVALDLVSRPEVFASLLPRLAQGYALEAIGGMPTLQCATQAADAFLDAAMTAPRSSLETPGLGTGVALNGRGVVGSGAEYEGELIQLSAFPVEDGRPGAAARALRPPIAGPSRRRPR